MKIWSRSFSNGQSMPEKFAFAKKDSSGRVCFSGNMNPEIAWKDLPDATRSLVLICRDRHVPVDLTRVNLPGVSIPKNALRRDFYHWVVCDINPDITSIPEKGVSNGVIVGGKPFTKHDDFLEGVNDYSDAFTGDQAMAGHYFGYDGPSPPLNDERLHWYEFILYALAVPSLGISGAFSALDVVPLLQKHCLDSASLKVNYAYTSEIVSV